MAWYTIKIIVNDVEADNEDHAFALAVEELNSQSPDCWGADIREIPSPAFEVTPVGLDA